MTTRPTSQNSITPFKYVVKASGDVNTDNTNIGAAISAMQEGDVLWVDGMVNVNGGHTTNVNISGILPYTPGSGLIVDPDSTKFTFGPRLNPYTQGTPKQLTAMNYGSPTFQSSDLAASPGDWVMLYSTDAPFGFAYHSAISPRSLEMFQIMDVIGTTYEIGMQTADVYQNGQLCQLLSMNSGFTMEGLNIEFNGQFTDSPSRIFEFNQWDGVYVRGCNIGPVSPGGLFQFYNCANVHVEGNTFSNSQNWDYYTTGTGYAVIVSGGNGFVIANNVFRGWRHAVTTGPSAFAGTSYRAGTCRNVLVSNNVVNHCDIPNVGGMYPFSPHAEGFGIVFSGNVVEMDMMGTSAAFYLRSRDTIVSNNVVRGGPLRKHAIDTPHQGRGVLLIGPDNCRIENNVFEDIGTGVEFATGSGAKASAFTSITGNDFSYLSGAALWQNGNMQQTRFTQNSLYDCGMITSSRTNKYMLRVDGSTTGMVDVADNTFSTVYDPATGNSPAALCYFASSQFDGSAGAKFYGNTVYGWDTLKLAGSNSAQVDLCRRTWQQHNRCIPFYPTPTAT